MNEAELRMLAFRTEPRRFAKDALAKLDTGVTAFNCDPPRRGELSSHKEFLSKDVGNPRNCGEDCNSLRIVNRDA